MVSGCTCGNAYRVGTGFDFVVQQGITSSSDGSKPYLTSTCAEIGAWYGTQYEHIGWSYYVTLNAASGGVINISNSSGLIIRSGVTSTTQVNIAPCTFCEIAVKVIGNGSASVSGQRYGKYFKIGDSIGLSITTPSGYVVKKVEVNGSIVSDYATIAVSSDLSIVVYIVPSAYNVTCNTPSGGTVAFTKNGAAQTLPFTAAVDDVIVCTATPNADKMVQNFVVDGLITSGGSTGPQSFSFTIYERADDATYNCSVTFADRTAATDSVVGKSNGTTDDATVTCNGVAVTRTDGAFMAFIGNTYLATAHEPTIFRTYDGWVNGNGELVSAAYAYGWTQGSQSVAITASYTDKPLYTENFLVGTSTADAGTTSGTAYLAGCRADIARPSGESKIVGTETKYLGGTRTVTAHGAASTSTPLPTGWSFVGVYVSDTDASGGTKLYKANGASAVTFDCACNANIYALFQNGAVVDPSDVDQGDSQIASGAAANGLYEWEGSESNMAMRYHSKRFVSSMPMTLSTARVYADGYATSGTNDVKLKTLTFQSPDSTDAKAVDTTAKSQDAYRLPMRRPEKYIEMVVAAPHEVTQIAVATSMEGLWQA